VRKFAWQFTVACGPSTACTELCAHGPAISAHTGRGLSRRRLPSYSYLSRLPCVCRRSRRWTLCAISLPSPTDMCAAARVCHSLSRAPQERPKSVMRCAATRAVTHASSCPAMPGRAAARICSRGMRRCVHIWLVFMAMSSLTIGDAHTQHFSYRSPVICAIPTGQLRHTGHFLDALASAWPGGIPR